MSDNKTDAPVAFGLAVRERRKETGLTQEKLARAADTTVTTISRIENEGQIPGLDLAMAIAKALGTDVGALVGVMIPHGKGKP